MFIFCVVEGQDSRGWMGEYKCKGKEAGRGKVEIGLGWRDLLLGLMV